MGPNLWTLKISVINPQGSTLVGSFFLKFNSEEEALAAQKAAVDNAINLETDECFQTRMEGQ